MLSLKFCLFAGILSIAIVVVKQTWFPNYHTISHVEKTYDFVIGKACIDLLIKRLKIKVALQLGVERQAAFLHQS